LNASRWQRAEPFEVKRSLSGQAPVALSGARRCASGFGLKGNGMKISARNALEGTIKEIHKGATTAHVEIELKGGAIVTASITNESVDELKLAPGQKAHAIIKSSDVMVAVD
jgi:molybdopterin-binding protein